MVPQVLALIGAGAVPPVPVTVYDYGDFTAAFRSMQKAQHTGKLVLSRYILSPLLRLVSSLGI